MKGVRKYLVWILILGVVFVIYKVLTFKLFDNELVLIDKLPVNQADYSVILYLFPSSATVKGAIQLHLMQDNTGDSRLYKNYDNYNKVVFAKIPRDSILLLGLQDTIGYNGKIDTLRVKLPDQY